MKSDLLQQLERPFEPSTITWKPGSVRKDGTAALALAYGDLRVYMERLDEVCDMGWSVAYTPWAERIICHLTIDGITRSSTGEPTSESERGEIGGTVAEAQAFKRACAMFGLGRYLYKLPSLWVEWDADKRTFTKAGQAKLASVLDRHYQEWLTAHQVKAPAPQPQHRQQRPPADAPPPPKAVEDDVDFGMGGSEWDNLPNREASDNAFAERSAAIMHSDAEISDLAVKLIKKCSELDRTSGDKTLSVVNKDGTGAGQYGPLVGRIDKLTTAGAHRFILSALCGRPISKATPPGWKVKELTDWLNDEKGKAATELAIRNVWAAVQQVEKVTA